MDSFVRISAQNSSNIARDSLSINNIIDFEIPAGSVYDMSKCYISLPFRITETGDDVCGFILTDTVGNKLNPTRLIKNIHVKSDRLGVLEDIKEVGVLRNTLNNYIAEASKDCATNNVFGSYDNFGNVNTPFRLLRREGSEASEKHTVECQIYLKDIISLGNQEAYSTAKYGSLYITIELNLSAISVKQIQGTTDNADRIFPKASYMDKDSVEGERKDFENPGNQTDLTLFTLTTDAVYTNLKFSPFHVGQALTIIKGAGTGDVRSPNTIASIAQGADGKLVITFTGSILTAIGNPTSMSASVPDKTALYHIDAPEIVMSKTNNSPPDMFEIMTFNTELDSSASGTAINKVYQVAPNSVNVLVLSPIDDKGRSSFNGLVDYRFRVDNQEVTDRAVGSQTSLHYALLHDVFKNMGMLLKDVSEDELNLKRKEQQNITAAVSTAAVNELIGCALPDNGQPKLVDIEINSTAGPAQINIYSQVVKQF